MHWPHTCALDFGLSPVRTGHSLMRRSTNTRLLLTCRDLRHGLQIWVTGGWDPYTKSRMQREKTQEKALFSTEIYQPLQVMLFLNLEYPCAPYSHIWPVMFTNARIASIFCWLGLLFHLIMLSCALQDTWKTGPDMPERRAFHQCVSIGGSIYVLGGFDGVRDLDSVCKLDTSTGASRSHINPKFDRVTASSQTGKRERCYLVEPRPSLSNSPHRPVVIRCAYARTKKRICSWSGEGPHSRHGRP
jgi:hypothetical protein